MKILLVSPFDLVPERLWGPSARIFAIARQAQSMGHTVLLAGGEPYKTEPAKEKDGVPFVHIPTSPFHRYPYAEELKDEITRSWRPFFFVRLLWLVARRASVIIGICRRERIDVIYMGRTFPETALACFAARFFTGVPIVVDWDDVEGLMGFSSKMGEPLWMQYMYTFCETYFASRANAVVAASRFLCGYVRDVGVKKENLFYAPTFADHLLFRPNVRPPVPGSPTLFYAGNLWSGNGLDMEIIIESFVKVKKEIPGARLVIVGGGDLLEKDGVPGLLPQSAERFGVKGSVEFVGDIPHALMPQQMEKADLCLALFPVNVITLAKSPIKVYEYMCAGKPVVARAVGEISHSIKDGENGFLVYTDDADEYARKIITVLGDPQRLKAVGENARKSVEAKFNWGLSAKEAMKACERAISTRGK